MVDPTIKDRTSPKIVKHWETTSAVICVEMNMIDLLKSDKFSPFVTVSYTVCCMKEKAEICKQTLQSEGGMVKNERGCFWTLK